MELFKHYSKKKIELKVIESYYQLDNYLELYQLVEKAVQQGILIPIKSSGSNGKKPALPKSYRIQKVIENEQTLKDELLYLLHPKLNQDYYLRHLSQYSKDRDAILKLSYFLTNQASELEYATTINERSFQIWQKEKYLAEEGSRLLKNVGFSIQQLNIYETAEPLAYFSVFKEAPQNILIIENKDTFYSLRKHLIEGHSNILGMKFGTLIYSGGKKGIKGFKHFESSVEPYLMHDRNKFYYFGDLDYEGILIFEQLCSHFYCEPFVKAYELMVEKANSIQLPRTKEKQNRNIKGAFFSYFANPASMNLILEREEYIPQEILTMKDF